ncbi:HNH endonuclease [uncultured Clostridium sp.]|uniref:HNH endonuclease n=1 Tax=uncultured Clostridium sp. TaxID=59620 RepID=UPI00258DC202|nr:HNH endonuclease [uncultured Clostridium sp.]
MSAFMKFAEINWQESSLAKLAKEMTNKSMDITELDKPLSVEKENDSSEKKETRPLTEDEKNDIQQKTGWSDDQMKKCTIDEDGVIHYKCDNEDLEGKKHEGSGVEYVRKTIEVNGVKVEVVVPNFDSAFDAQLPEDLLKESNPKQFKECNDQLKDAINKDPELRNKFTEEQIEDIMDGKTPEGYTWHHDVETGKMELVETKLHDRTQGGAAHTGGKSIWGGGYNNK